MFTNLIIWPFITSLVISFIVTPIVIWWYRRHNFVDDPTLKQHAKIVHLRPVPRGGGIPIGASLLVAGGLFLTWDKHLLGILLGAAILMIVGIIDDLKDLSPYLRLVTGLLAALVVVGSGIGVAYITNPLVAGEVISFAQPQLTFSFAGQVRNIWIVADLLAIIWIIWMMNMVNWSKGVDGQMPGFVTIAAVVIGLLSLRFIDDVTQWEVITLAMITAGSYLGLLFWNAYPQKIMPGYGGGSMAGYLLAVLAILSGAKVATLVLVLGIPTLDALYTIIRRIGAGKSPVWGDRGHLHHRLLDLGWTKKRIAYFYWFMSGLLGGLSLTLNSTQKLFSVLSLALVVGGAILWLQLFARDTTGDIYE